MASSQSNLPLCPAAASTASTAPASRPSSPPRPGTPHSDAGRQPSPCRLRDLVPRAGFHWPEGRHILGPGEDKAMVDALRAAGVELSRTSFSVMIGDIFRIAQDTLTPLLPTFDIFVANIITRTPLAGHISSRVAMLLVYTAWKARNVRREKPLCPYDTIMPTPFAQAVDNFEDTLYFRGAAGTLKYPERRPGDGPEPSDDGVSEDEEVSQHESDYEEQEE